VRRAVGINCATFLAQQQKISNEITEEACEARVLSNAKLAGVRPELGRKTLR